MVSVAAMRWCCWEEEEEVVAEVEENECSKGNDIAKCATCQAHAISICGGGAEGEVEK